VRINRDFGGLHSRMDVIFDDKIRTGRAVPPGLPKNPTTASGTWYIASWKQLP
jgi:hypothetical protein